MGNRLSRIVTRTGDGGKTALASGARIGKTHARVYALGEVDELNSHLGVLLAHKVPPGMVPFLERIQHELFNLGGELSLPGAILIEESHVAELETEAKRLNAKLPPLKEFVLPGGSPVAAAAHLSRAVCRRAERSAWVLNDVDPINPQALRYLNRLSDALFIVARTLARVRGGKEKTWKGARHGSGRVTRPRLTK